MAARGNYQTPQREAVELFFSAHPDACLDAEEVYRSLCDRGEKMGKTTVYRAIARLCEQNVLRCYVPEGHGAALYQYNPCTQEHLHIRCIRCGALEHLHCDEVENFRAHLLQHHGFTLNEGKTLLYGLCENCRKESAHEE